MTKKMKAALTLGALTVAVAVVGVGTPNLGYFIGGDMDSMFEMGKTIGGVLGEALGNPIFGLLGIILFVA